jgi:hypothetical protein
MRRQTPRRLKSVSELANAGMRSMTCPKKALSSQTPSGGILVVEGSDDGMAWKEDEGLEEWEVVRLLSVAIDG